jgi:hypothetical protein
MSEDRVPATPSWLRFYVAALQGMTAANFAESEDLNAKQVAIRARRIADAAEEVYQSRLRQD